MLYTSSIIRTSVIFIFLQQFRVTKADDVFIATNTSITSCEVSYKEKDGDFIVLANRIVTFICSNDAASDLRLSMSTSNRLTCTNEIVSLHTIQYLKFRYCQLDAFLELTAFSGLKEIDAASIGLHALNNERLPMYRAGNDRLELTIDLSSNQITRRTYISTG